MLSGRIKGKSIGIGADSQAVRISMRHLLASENFPNARSSPNVIFKVLSDMSLMYLKKIDLTSEHMQKLRQIAINQTSMEVMISSGKYDGSGCYSHWEKGNLIPMHFSSPKNHTSLYDDENINPLGLEAPIWWALMMSMLGLFDKQLSVYEGALRALNIEPTVDDFLQYFYERFHNYIEGNVIVGKITVKVYQSAITMEPFPSDQQIFMFVDHNNCRVKQCYSQIEIDGVNETGWSLRRNGCIYCHRRPGLGELVLVSNEDAEIQLQKLIAASSLASSPLRVKPGMVNFAVIPSSASSASLPLQRFNNGGRGGRRQGFNSYSSSHPAPTLTYIVDRVVVVMLKGITGAGKSTFSTELIKQVTEKNFFSVCKHFCPDDINKKLSSGQRLIGVEQTEKDLRHFVLNLTGNRFCIIDTCGERYNENDPRKICFNVSLAGLEVMVVKPNFDETDIIGYEHFCLFNVLNRGNHSATTSYWLNPVSATYETCMKVHNDKARAFLGAWHSDIRTTNIAQTLSFIQPKAEEYKRSLKSPQDTVNDFISAKLSF